MRAAVRLPSKARMHSAGITLMEVMVCIAILAMMSLLLYGSFSSLGKGRKAESMRMDRARQARQALARMTRELQSAYLSAHTQTNAATQTRITAFIGQNGTPFDRIDFAAFAHVRTVRDSKESDQAEIGYFVSNDPDDPDKRDLVRREQVAMDLEPKKGGIVNVVCEHVERFDIQYLDPLNGRWLDYWDTMQAAGQPNRLPLAVKIVLTVKGVGDSPPQTLVSKVFLPMQQPLGFGMLQ
jgi:general secretion pathway protein J